MVRKKSSGESDIDLTIFREDPPDRAIVEVKGWHTETFTKSYFTTKRPKDYRSRIFHFLRPEATKAANKFFKNKPFRRIIVVPKISEKDRAEIVGICNKKGVEILEFTNILNRIIQETKTNKNYKDSEFQQAVRLMKVYKFI